MTGIGVWLGTDTIGSFAEAEEGDGVGEEKEEGDEEGTFGERDSEESAGTGDGDFFWERLPKREKAGAGEGWLAEGGGEDESGVEVVGKGVEVAELRADGEEVEEGDRVISF